MFRRKLIASGITLMLGAPLSAFAADSADMLQIRNEIKALKQSYEARIEALELENLIEVAVATMVSAEARKETRGAHDRADFHDRPGFVNGRDDEHWLKHTLWYKEGNRLDYKPVNLQPLTVESFAPKARTY